MEEPKSFEQIRQEVEQSQRATVFPDTVRNLHSFLSRASSETPSYDRRPVGA
jgi:hypothetical protein